MATAEMMIHIMTCRVFVELIVTTSEKLEYPVTQIRNPKLPNAYEKSTRSNEVNVCVGVTLQGMCTS